MAAQVVAIVASIVLAAALIAVFVTAIRGRPSRHGPAHDRLPDLEPPWWPGFERQFARYVKSQRRRTAK